MAIRTIRIILDTNWYVNATINKNSRRTLYNLLTNPRLTILFSTEILKEYILVIERDKFRKIIKKSQVNRFMNLVTSKLEVVELKSDIKGNRDHKDNFLLSLSLDGNADYLITGDLDLLVLKTAGSTKILTIKDFIDELS